MGVFYDYYRALDGAAAAAAADARWRRPMRRRPPRPMFMGAQLPAEDQEPFDAVDTKWIEPAVTLGRLVGFVTGVPWSVDLVELTEIGLDEDADDGLLQLGDGVRDVLATVTAEQVPELVARWAAIEEFGGHPDTDYLAEVLTSLAGLSRRAQAAGEHLYCWWSL